MPFRHRQIHLNRSNSSFLLYSLAQSLSLKKKLVLKNLTLLISRRLFFDVYAQRYSLQLYGNNFYHVLLFHIYTVIKLLLRKNKNMPLDIWIGKKTPRKEFDLLKFEMNKYAYVIIK